MVTTVDSKRRRVEVLVFLSFPSHNIIALLLYIYIFKLKEGQSPGGRDCKSRAANDPAAPQRGRGNREEVNMSPKDGGRRQRHSRKTVVVLVSSQSFWIRDTPDNVMRDMHAQCDTT